ncbi:hypothetical protein [Cryobacterium sp. CG_9.6]|uniref:hypothetical protein n=1 Tax=Cryobacterium sp. CG_9.6 TaxID=2760710 RepID=UPI002473DF79|nr:hypothetical protein [Cryobacterium sp. CG_9.6]MDH6238601.1 hypothetical protein [Cryobacterium sp. CG_9.6]
MTKPGPRAGGPSLRWVFTPAEKLDHLSAYEEASRSRGDGAYLREQGIHSSQVKVVVDFRSSASILMGWRGEIIIDRGMVRWS